VVKRLFLNRVRVDRNWPAVHQASQFAVDIHPGAAFPSFTALEHATLSAKKAFHDCRLIVVHIGLQFLRGFVARRATVAG
jgi:hypothetical protein